MPVGEIGLEEHWWSMGETSSFLERGGPLRTCQDGKWGYSFSHVSLSPIPNEVAGTSVGQLRWRRRERRLHWHSAEDCEERGNIVYGSLHNIWKKG